MAFILEIAITMVVVTVGVSLFKALFDKVIATSANPISSCADNFSRAHYLVCSQEDKRHWRTGPAVSRSERSHSAT